MALNCILAPKCVIGLTGVTFIETRVTAVTVIVVWPVIFPNAAIIEVLPPESDVAKPCVAGALLIDAIDGSEELHVTEDVRSWVVASEKMPVALNCWVMPFTTVGSLGVISRETRETPVTVREVVPEILPEAAAIVVVPAERAFADPLSAALLLIAAIETSEELQVTDEVMSWVEWSVKVPVALNCTVVPVASVGFLGVTSIDASAAAVTVRDVEPEMLPEVAVTLVVPAESDCARPLDEASLLMEATASSDRLHVTDPVMSWVELSENTPVALNCWTVPSAILEFAGLTSRDIRRAGGLSPPPQPQPVRKAESSSAKKNKTAGFFIASSFLFIFVVPK